MFNRAHIAAQLDLIDFSMIDSHCEADLAPFWGADLATTPAACACPKCERARFDAQLDAIEAAEWRDIVAEMDMREADERWALIAEAALWCPMPPAVDTGELISVEWQAETGYRYWVKIDRGHLSREIWYHHQSGDSLSDVCD